jgi:hypothetical protein
MTTSSFPFCNSPTANLPGLHLVAGRILLDATTPTVSSGKGFTVEKTATGRYTITFNRTVKVIATVGMLAQATASDTKLRKPVWNESVEGANMVEFATEDEEGVLEDAASTAEIEFISVVMAPATGHPD